MNRALSNYIVERNASRYDLFFKAVEEWQRGEGNNCTVCWNHNMITRCGVCGWWGKVPPDGYIVKVEGPDIKNFVNRD